MVRSPEVTKGQILPFSTFFYKSAHNLGTWRATTPRKSAFDSYFNAVSSLCSQIWPMINGLASREQKLKNSRFAKKVFYINTFDSVKIRISPCQHRICFLETRQKNYNVTLIGHFENLTSRSFQVRSWSDRKRSCCISVDPYGRLEHIYGVLIALAGLYQILPKNCWRPFMTWNDLGDMARGHWSQYSGSGCQVYQWPDVKSVLNGFLPKEAAFHFLPIDL